MTQDINTALGIAQPSSTSTKPADLNNRSAKAMARYKDGYLHARTVNGFGGVIKVASLVIGCLLMFAGFAAFADVSAHSGMGEFGVIRVIGFVVVGFLIAAPGYILGVLIQSAGQSMKAHFDCAVNGSHFLNDDQRAEVMSLD